MLMCTLKNREKKLYQNVTTEDLKNIEKIDMIGLISIPLLQGNDDDSITSDMPISETCFDACNNVKWEELTSLETIEVRNSDFFGYKFQDDLPSLKKIIFSPNSDPYDDMSMFISLLDHAKNLESIVGFNANNIRTGNNNSTEEIKSLQKRVNQINTGSGVTTVPDELLSFDDEENIPINSFKKEDLTLDDVSSSLFDDDEQMQIEIDSRNSNDMNDYRLLYDEEKHQSIDLSSSLEEFTIEKIDHAPELSRKISELINITYDFSESPSNITFGCTGTEFNAMSEEDKSKIVSMSIDGAGQSLPDNLRFTGCINLRTLSIKNAKLIGSGVEYERAEGATTLPLLEGESPTFPKLTQLIINGCSLDDEGLQNYINNGEQTIKVSLDRVEMEPLANDSSETLDDQLQNRYNYLEIESFSKAGKLFKSEVGIPGVNSEASTQKRSPHVPLMRDNSRESMRSEISEKWFQAPPGVTIYYKLVGEEESERYEMNAESDQVLMNDIESLEIVGNEGNAVNIITDIDWNGFTHLKRLKLSNVAICGYEGDLEDEQMPVLPELETMLINKDCAINYEGLVHFAVTGQSEKNIILEEGVQRAIGDQSYLLRDDFTDEEGKKELAKINRLVLDINERKEIVTEYEETFETFSEKSKSKGTRSRSNSEFSLPLSPTSAKDVEPRLKIDTSGLSYVGTPEVSPNSKEKSPTLMESPILSPATHVVTGAKGRNVQCWFLGGARDAVSKSYDELTFDQRKNVEEINIYGNEENYDLLADKSIQWNQLPNLKILKISNATVQREIDEDEDEDLFPALEILKLEDCKVKMETVRELVGESAKLKKIETKGILEKNGSALNSLEINQLNKIAQSINNRKKLKQSFAFNKLKKNMLSAKEKRVERFQNFRKLNKENRISENNNNFGLSTIIPSSSSIFAKKSSVFFTPRSNSAVSQTTHNKAQKYKETMEARNTGYHKRSEIDSEYSLPPAEPIEITLADIKNRLDEKLVKLHKDRRINEYMTKIDTHEHVLHLNYWNDPKKKPITVLDASLEKVTVYKSWCIQVDPMDKNISLKNKALLVLDSLGIPPCPDDIDISKTNSRLAKQVRIEFDLLYSDPKNRKASSAGDEEDFTVFSKRFKK